MPSSATVQQIKGVTPNSPLPPSVEYAYYQKCIALKRRINEIEESNDTVRLRKARISRAILKMRLERAMLLEQLQKRMEHNVDGSDRSDSPPPTPQEKPLRSKRTHRKSSPNPDPAQTAQASPSAPEGGASQPGFTVSQSSHLPPQSSARSTPDPSRPTSFDGPAPRDANRDTSHTMNGASIQQQNGIGDGTQADQPGRDENGETNGAKTDVEMADAQSGGGAAFTAVNQ